MRVSVSLLFAVVLFSGCSSPSSTRKVMSLERFQHIFVETRLNDNHRVGETIVAELRRLGRDATAGPRTMIPQNADAVLTYDSRWEWDFKTYLIELSLELHTAHSNKKLADARYYRPSIRTESADAVVHDLLAPLFEK